MRIVCSYCKKSLGDAAPFDVDETTPDLCDACDVQFDEKFRRMSLGEYLDDIREPILVVDSDGRILAANEAMAVCLGRVERRTRGLLGGEVLECAYARLPGGCGGTEHCQTCAIRRAVTRTLETGERQVRVSVHLQKCDGVVPMEVSTRRVGPAVFVTIPAQAA